MDNKIAYRAIEKVAERNGVPLEEVMNELQAAINAAWTGRKDSTVTMTDSFSDEGQLPSPVALIALIAEIVSST